MKHQKKLLALLAGLHTASAFALDTTTHAIQQKIALREQPGFFRFTFDDVKMPNNIENMGLLGIGYMTEITPTIYGGVTGFGSVTGSQGGLFVLGAEGGVHHEFLPNWWADADLFAGGGGGKASLVGGGLMLRPQVGIAYSWHGMRFGLHYGYITFPYGDIHSYQVGLNLDIPCNFYYVMPDETNRVYTLNEILFQNGKYLTVQRNDFAIILQAYQQKAGTKNIKGNVQDGTINLVGAEFDHYFTDRQFWYVKAGGAFHGIPNGYMDVLGGWGLNWRPTSYGFSIVPQLGAGAGGGGYQDTGGGVIVQPQLGLEVPLTSDFGARVSGGYLWAPKGTMRAYTATGELIYHLDFLTPDEQVHHNLPFDYRIQQWRFNLFNQIYLHPQRTYNNVNSSIDMVVFQVDQLFTKNFFFSYQAASAYKGYQAGGYATGMIGPGLQTNSFGSNHFQIFSELLIGAGGGGGLAISGGALIEPLIGAHLALTRTLGAQVSYGYLKSLQNNLKTPVVNVGLTVRLGMLDPN